MEEMNTTETKTLRRTPTKAKRTLWEHLRLPQLHGLKFRRQFTVGPYLFDFVCLEKGLLIELAREQHSNQVTYDSEHTKWLESERSRLLKFWHSQVSNEIAAVKVFIPGRLERSGDTPNPNFLPQMGKELRYP